ncbi:MAG: DUF167 domain-containing protein [Candidatus Nanoarchaeia archaeon]
MGYQLKVKTNAKENKIEFKDGIYFVSIKEKPIEGKANKAIIKLFKKELKKNIRIIKGLKSSEKVIELLD